MHNSLQGMYYDWTPAMREIWLNYNKLNADLFDEDYDFIVMHDPQPAAMLTFLEERRGSPPPGKWVWRCHIDLTEAQVQVWDLLRPHVERYDGAIFTLKQYVKDDLVSPQIFDVPPAIDPLSPKNTELPQETIDAILERYGVDPHRPIVSQISRFDPWKDPLGVIDVYRAVKEEFPDLQLVMIASMASDDPGGLGLVRTYRPARGRGLRCPHPVEPQRRGERGGECLPAGEPRRHPEVGARGIRPGGVGGALEGAPRRRRQRGRHPAADHGWRDGLPREHARRSASRSWACCCGILLKLTPWERAASSTSAAISSRHVI